MSASETLVHNVYPESITATFTRELQDIALRGWAASTGRSDAELRTQFNSQSSRHVAGVREIYKRYAAQEAGGLVIATGQDDADIRGFALAANDISGNYLAQAYKRTFDRKKVYAHIRHVCVDVPYQGLGIGNRLVTEVLQSFEPTQKPTAYVFDENSVAIAGIKRLGFNLSPPDQEPKKIEGYFGENAPAVYQRRYEAASVAAVLNVIAASQNS